MLNTCTFFKETIKNQTKGVDDSFLIVFRTFPPHVVFVRDPVTPYMSGKKGDSIGDGRFEGGTGDKTLFTMR